MHAATHSDSVDTCNPNEDTDDISLLLKKKKKRSV